MQHPATASTGPAPETRALSGAGPARHPFQHAAPGATVDVDLCAKCGRVDGGDRHANPARIDEARAALISARCVAVVAIGARRDAGRDAGRDDAVIADLERYLARAIDLLDGLTPPRS